MGDATYVPLMSQLVNSPNERVRRAAIAGLGDLGGDAAVKELLELARTGDSVEQNDAVTALGHTKSRAAVKGLIDLMASDGMRPGIKNDWPLFVLTHHRLENATRVRSAMEVHDAWQSWWDEGGKSNPVYGPYDCAPVATPSQNRVGARKRDSQIREFLQIKAVEK